MMTLAFGFELECIVPKDAYNGRIGGYHSGYRDRDWMFKIESDTSLSVDSTKEDTHRAMELISDRIYSESELRVCLFNMQKVVPQFEINSSCGLHLHFSFQDQDRRIAKFEDTDNVMFNNAITKRIFYEFLKEYTKAFGKNIAREWYRRTCRGSYSKKGTRITDERGLSQFYGRTTEKGIEWRGFHMQGSQGYPALEWYLNTAYKIIKSVMVSTNVLSSKKKLMMGTRVSLGMDRKAVSGRVSNVLTSPVVKKVSCKCAPDYTENTYHFPGLCRISNGQIDDLVHKYIKDTEHTARAVTHPFINSNLFRADLRSLEGGYRNSANRMPTIIYRFFSNYKFCKLNVKEVENYLVRKEILDV